MSGEAKTLRDNAAQDFFAAALVHTYGKAEALERTCGPMRKAVERVEVPGKRCIGCGAFVADGEPTPCGH